MGCDIHLYVEKRNASGEWVTADTWHDDEDEPGRKSVYLWGPGLKCLAGPLYSGRNYDLFAVLANVRNGYGVAGCDTGEGFVPIAEPRGVPEDACREYLDEVSHWDGDGHSHSWLTLRELLDFDWLRVSTKRGWVSPYEWAQWRDRGRPSGCSGGVGGGQVTHHTPEAFEDAWQKVRKARGYPEQRQASAHIRPGGEQDDLEMLRELLGGHPYTQVAWEVSYAEACSNFWADAMPRLLAMSEGRYDDLRITFFFDN